MSSQTYATHAHRPVPTLLGFLFLLISIVAFVFHKLNIGGPWTVDVGMTGLILSVLMLLSISRVYTTRLQDRIIRLEMRLRAAEILTPEQQRLLRGLDPRHIAALRFASDEELPALLERAVRESMTVDAIKRAVRTWVPDLDRT